MKAAKRKLATKPKRKPTMVEKHEPPPPPPHPAAGKTTDAPPDLKTEQEKGKKDPVDKAVPPGPIPKSIEDEGIGPRDPYPSGSPPKPVAGKPMNAPPDEPAPHHAKEK